MVFKQVLMIIISLFFVAGIADYSTGNKFGLGSEFYKAFAIVGRVMLSIVGMICLSPVLADILKPVVVPIFTAIGADPAIFGSMILPPDSGGYAVSMSLAQNELVGLWSGTVVASHIGSAVMFVIPVCIGIIPEKHYRNFSLGALSGIIACPVGCFAGGLIAGLGAGTAALNLVPAVIISAVIAAGLIFAPNLIIRIFVIFGKILTAVVLFGFTVAAVERMTGYVIIPGMNPITDGFVIAGIVTLTAAGVICMTSVITKRCEKPLSKLSSLLKTNNAALSALLGTTAVIVVSLADIDNIDDRGIVLCSAFITSGANLFGAHLGFVGVYVPQMVLPMVLAKLISGVFAIFLALIFCQRRAVGANMSPL